jgi:hypothetical protein
MLRAGASGLAHGNRGRPSPRRLPDAVADRIVELAATERRGFNDSHLVAVRAEERAPSTLEVGADLTGPRRLPGQARWARKSSTTPDTPLSSTSPIDWNAIPSPCDASAAAWLTSTSPALA